MKKPTLDQIVKFLFFALPAYWTVALTYIALVVWKDGLLISVALLSAAIIVAAILLMRNCHWICLPMILLGIFIALQDDQFAGHIFRFYGIYLVLHYAVCGLYVNKSRKK